MTINPLHKAAFNKFIKLFKAHNFNFYKCGSFFISGKSKDKFNYFVRFDASDNNLFEFELNILDKDIPKYSYHSTLESEQDVEDYYKIISNMLLKNQETTFEHEYQKHKDNMTQNLIGKVIFQFNRDHKDKDKDPTIKLFEFNVYFGNYWAPFEAYKRVAEEELNAKDVKQTDNPCMSFTLTQNQVKEIIAGNTDLTRQLKNLTLGENVNNTISKYFN